METEARKTSKVSMSTMHYLGAAKASLQASTPFSSELQWMYMRAQAVSGAQTLEHVDNFRGNAKSYVLFHPEQFQGKEKLQKTGLTVKMFPQFRTSFVKLKAGVVPDNGVEKDALFIPFSFKQGQYLKMIGEDPKVKGNAVRFVFDWWVVDMLEPFAELNFIVAGVKGGKLQTTPLWDENGIHKSPTLSLKLTPINTAFNQAKRSVYMNGKMALPQKMEVDLRCSPHAGQNSWMGFQAWRFIHKFYGEADVPRTHVFFVLAREVISGANFNMNATKRKQNYTSVKVMKRTKKN
jgi:hypothetical protein